MVLSPLRGGLSGKSGGSLPSFPGCTDISGVGALCWRGVQQGAQRGTEPHSFYPQAASGIRKRGPPDPRASSAYAEKFPEGAKVRTFSAEVFWFYRCGVCLPGEACVCICITLCNQVL